MRIYSSPAIAIREIERDLKEMGICYESSTVQDKNLAGEDRSTKELVGYGFQISTDQTIRRDEFIRAIRYRTPEHPGDDLEKYFMTEMFERWHASRNPDRNPGTAHTFRPSMWEQYQGQDGRFAYTYPERMAPQWGRVLATLANYPGSRHAIIHFFDGISVDHSGVKPGLDSRNTHGLARVPCSMFYQFLNRDGKIDMIYVMRSCDFINHFAIDLCLALSMQDLVANDLGLKRGLFTMMISSLHAFKRDVSGTDIF